MPLDTIPPGIDPWAPTSVAVQSVVVRHGGKLILDRLSARISGGGISAVIGPNGAGKTTLLRVLNGLVVPDGGAVLWGDQQLPPAAVHQSFLLQHPVLLRRTVKANLKFAARRAPLARAGKKALIDSWLKKTGLDGIADRPARALSGGERKRLALASALAAGPDVLLLDEPSAGLDPGATRQLEAMILEAASRRIKIIMSTHDIGQMHRLADEVLFLHDGKLIEAGSAEKLLNNPQSPLLASFLGGELLW